MNAKTGQSTSTRRGGPAFGFILSIYFSLLILMLVASFFPQYRVWGFDHWAHYPIGIAIVILIAGAALPYLLRKAWATPEESPSDIEQPVGGGRYVLVVAILIAVYMAAFYILRARTHYLGDGYQLLANLPTVNPWIKLRNLGEELIHKAVFGLLSGEASARSLKSFQLVSYTSGFIFLLSVATVAKYLFASVRERLLFFLGVATGGYVLLYFGYVENYSVFVTCVTIYALTGLMVLSGRIKRWYILIPMVLAALMHTLGATLIVPTIYLMISETRVAAWLTRQSHRVKIVLSAIALALFLIAIWYLRTHLYLFRFALVPVTVDTFTVEGYTLFSLKHVVDIVNLCFVLLPSFPVFAVIALWAPFRKSAIGREMIFLGAMTLSALAAVLLFDPKLGMPRDWDLFSFCGIPAAILAYYSLLKSGLPLPIRARVATLAIFLGLSVLLPRAAGRALGYIEVAHVENYIRHDVRKNKNINFILRNYYTEQGNNERAEALLEQWHQDFPERDLNERGLKLRNEGKYAEAVQCFLGAIGHNPSHVPTYAVLAACYRQMGQLDRARVTLEVANGMDPNNVNVLVEFAYLHRQRAELAEAEKYFNRVLSIEPFHLYASLGLLEVLWSSAQHAKHDALLVRVAEHPDAPAGIHMRLGYKYLTDRLYSRAETQFRQAMAKGADSATVQVVLDSLAVLRQ